MHRSLNAIFMKQFFMLVLCTFSLFTTCAPGKKNGMAPATENNSGNKTNPTDIKMKLKIGNRTFIATLYDNATSAAFKSLLPLTVNMTELNSNEKFVDLSKNLPVNASKPGTIQAGDMMLYGSNTLVLFYKMFSTSYFYTKLGRIDDSSGLVEALGSGNVKVTFESE